MYLIRIQVSPVNPIKWANRRSLLRWAVIAVALLLPLILGLSGSSILSLVALALLVVGGVILVFLKWPAAGPLALVLGSLFIPGGIATGTQTEISFAIILVALLVILWLLEMAGGRAKFYQALTVPPLLAFLGVVLLAFLAGQVPWLRFAQRAPFHAQVGGAAVFILSIGAYFLAANRIRSLRWLQALTWAFLIGGGLLVLERLGLNAGISEWHPSQSGADGALFWTWLVALAFSQMAFNRKLGWFWRIVLACILAAVFYLRVVLYSTWTSGWLPALAAIVVISLAGSPRKTVAVLGVGALLGLAFWPRISGFMMGGDNEYSLVTRLEAWRILGEIILANPILGLGPANYYWYTPLYPILGYAVQFNSHNNYVDIVAQTGILGLGCFLWFAWKALQVGLALWKEAPHGFERAFALGSLGGLVGTLVAAMLGDWVLPFVYNIGLAGFRASVFGWLFLGAMVSLLAIIREKEVVS